MAMTMFRPPRLGVGLVYSAFLSDAIHRDPDLVDFVEVEPETLWLQPAPGRSTFRMADAELERLRALPCVKLLHSIGFPVAGSCPPDLSHVTLLNRMADALDTPWVSEHLSFNTARISGVLTRTGMLLPQVQTQEGVDCAVHNARLYATVLNRPLALETGVNYLPPAEFELRDGDFIRRVVERANVGIVLDLHNLWTNERNGRARALDVVAELPLERVWEVHVAGGEERHGYWIDGHCGTMPPPVRDLAREVIPRLPNLGAITLEIFPAYLPRLMGDALDRELDFLRELWALPSASRPSDPATGLPAVAHAAPWPLDAPRVAEWEETLARAILRRPPTTATGRWLASHPAMSLYSELLEEFRASMVGTALGLTTRLLLLHLGKEGFDRLLAAFWRRRPPDMSASAEALGFGAFLCAERLDIPLLHEILSFEIGVVRAIVEERPQRVRVDCDIRLAISDLVARRIPARPGPTPFEFVIDPPAAGGDRAVRVPNLS
jgi:uncharacterized protein